MRFYSFPLFPFFPFFLRLRSHDRLHVIIFAFEDEAKEILPLSQTVTDSSSLENLCTCISICLRTDLLQWTQSAFALFWSSRTSSDMLFFSHFFFSHFLFIESTPLSYTAIAQDALKTNMERMVTRSTN